MALKMFQLWMKQVPSTDSFSTGQRAVPVMTLHETILIWRESCLEIRCGPEDKPSHCSICWLRHSSPGEEYCNTAEFGTMLYTIAQWGTVQRTAASILSRESSENTDICSENHPCSPGASLTRGLFLLYCSIHYDLSTKTMGVWQNCTVTKLTLQRLQSAFSS